MTPTTKTEVSVVRTILQIVAMALLLGCPALRAAISADETVLLYPALARSVQGGWEVQWSGIIYEREKRPAASFLTRQLFGLSGFQMSEAEEAMFTERSRLFLVDNERRKTIRVRLGDDSWTLGGPVRTAGLVANGSSIPIWCRRRGSRCRSDSMCRS